MKKTLVSVLLAATALLLCACQTDLFGPKGSDSDADGGPVRFKVAVNNLTKGAYTRTDDRDLVIPAVASVYHADGTTVLPSVYYEDQIGGAPIKLGYLVRYASGEYYLGENLDTAEPYVLPLGDLRLDLLAFAVSENDSNYYLDGMTFNYIEDDSHDWNDIRLNGWTSSENYKATWTMPVFSDATNYTKKLEFINVDTWYNPVDLMYASANGLSRANNTGHLVFKHAGAAVIFNIFRAAAPSNESVMLKRILFINPDYVPEGTSTTDTDWYYQSDPKHRTKLRGQLEHGEDPTINDELNQITLKTVGTLTIDNSRINLTAKWTTPTAYLENYRDPMKGHYLNNFDEGSVSLLNSFASSYEGDPEFYLESYDNPEANRPRQYGDPLMLPVQPVANAYLWYEIMSGASKGCYLYDLNLPRGVWQAGHVYIYNLYLDFTGVNFYVEVEPWEYLSSEFNYDYLENYGNEESGEVPGA